MRVLQRHIHVFADFRKLGDGGDEFPIDRRRISVEQANPRKAVDRMQLLEQLRQASAAQPAVAPPHRSVLRDQDQLFGSAVYERFGLEKNRLLAAAPELPAERRNDAK